MNHSEAWNIYEIFLLIAFVISLNFIPSLIKKLKNRKANKEKQKWERIISSRH